MPPAVGIVTSSAPPNAVVEIQGGMQVQPVVLVDQNGNYLTGSGSASTAGYLADATGTVNVAASTAPTTGQTLVATSATAATWQTPPGGVTTVSAGNTSIVIGGTSGAPTVVTGTLDVIATQEPPAANWSNNSHKITSLSNGTATNDAAAFGQIPTLNYGGVFGTGTDGSVTFDGTSTILGLAPSASTYTLARDIQCTSITINNGVTVKTGNFRIFCAGTLTNNGTISNNGNAASGSGAGGSGGSGSYLGGRAGGGGGTGVSGAGAAGSAANFGAAGGAGGAGTSGAAGSGGTTSAIAAGAQNNLLMVPTGMLTGVMGYIGTTLSVGWGAGGGGGGSDASSNAGGGGGGGGGVVAIFAYAVNNGSGTISAGGGAGGAGVAGNAGGGGGGSGGLVVAYTLSAWTVGTVTVSGGALGAKATGGSGSNGSNGGAGLSLNVVLT